MPSKTGRWQGLPLERYQQATGMHSGLLFRRPTAFTTQRPRAVGSRLPLPLAATLQRSTEQDYDRRTVLNGVAAGLAATLIRPAVSHAAAPKQLETPSKLLCDSECQSKLEGLQDVTTASGLRYKDIIVGKGPSPPTGYQVVAHYVAMTPDGRVFDSSLDKGRPYDLRIGADQVVAGLDEGVATMKTGGLRRIYVPGNLSFPKGLPSGPGRPRVPPSSPVVFDVQLLYIPGLDIEDEE